LYKKPDTTFREKSPQCSLTRINYYSQQIPPQRDVYPCSICNKLPRDIQAAHLDACSSESN